jgi:hypothetical protein
MRPWLVGAGVVAVALALAVLVSRALEKPADEQHRATDSNDSRTQAGPSLHASGTLLGTHVEDSPRDAGFGHRPGTSRDHERAAGLSHRVVAGGMSDAGSPPGQREQVLRRDQLVKQEYDRWYAAGYGPDQVDVELLPNGLLATRVTSGTFDDTPVSPGALTAWDLFRRDPQASLAIDDMRALTKAPIDECLDTFVARLEAAGHPPADGWHFEYVWRVWSRDGRGRVDVELEPAWWPAEFEDADRACYQAAIAEVERLEFITDTQDFDYRVEIKDYLPMEEP